MLFAISGSQGSGKTTVLSRLSLLGYPTIKRKTSRSILDEWGVSLSEVNNNRDLTVDFQNEILKRKIADEQHAVEDVGTIWFTERTYADLFTYALVSIGKDNEYSEWLNGYYNECAKAQKLYSHNFYLNSGVFPVVADGVRGVNQHYIQMVDQTMVYTLERMRYIDKEFVQQNNYTTVKGYTVAERVNVILQNISVYAPRVSEQQLNQEYNEQFGQTSVSGSVSASISNG